MTYYYDDDDDNYDYDYNDYYCYNSGKLTATLCC